MQIWTFSKHHTFRYDFWEKTQYSNMNFWCFLVTPDNYFSGTDGSVYLEFRSKKLEFKEKNEAFNCEQQFFFAKTYDFYFQRMILPLYV